MRALPRRAPALLGVLAVVTVVAGCGGGSSSDASKLIHDTFANAQNVRSGRILLQVQLAPKGSTSAAQGIAFQLSGPFSRTQKVPQFTFAMQTAVGGAQTFSGAITSTGNGGYVTYKGVSYRLPPKQYASFQQSFSSVQGFAQPKLGPGGTVDWLEHPKVVGQEPIDGVVTEHVTAGVSLPRLLSSLGGSRQITAAQRRQVTQVIRNPRFDFYTGKKDKLLRRVVISLGLNLPTSAQSAAGGLKSATMTIDYELSQLNQPQTVSAPANPQPFSQLGVQAQSEALGGTGLLGTLGGVSGTSPGSSGTSTTPAAPSGSGSASPPASGSSSSSGGATLSPKVQRYSNCIQQAGADVTKAQKCAALLK